MNVIQPGVLLLLLSACAAGPSAGDEEDVAKSVMGMYAAFKTRDVSKIAEFMTEGSTCYNATTSEMLVGRKAVLDHFGAILSQHKPGEDWASSITDMKVTSRGDLAIATYHVNPSQGGNHSTAAVTHVFQKIDGRWLAIHLHRSWNAMPK